MSDRTKNNIFNEPTQTTKVLIAALGNKRTLNAPQEADIIFQDDLTPPDFFAVIETNSISYDYIMYLGPQHNLVSTELYDRLINHFRNPVVGNVGALYTDVIVKNTNGNVICTKYHQSYNAALLKTKTILDTPFIVKKTLIPKFCPDIKYAHLYDGILWIIRHSYIFHLPEPIFELIDKPTNRDYSHDLKIIENLHYATYNSTN